ncbi:DNA-3-methyladenine glycosylase I [Glaciihabitans arcticus]|uniref:DNA-3-methyladenine glycosylase I n=1 Tax=Glaciihabitans arcticus TaxID=2668039 RepID=A0A4Q9GQP6_9MICO|nr:DNA-3-methyladenine glycosylase I [Glaciihabitans arcticus]TBN56324.1 DNA-3-methyladenine glycosylase I [Glaciihabitans arcticus]
MVIDTPAVQSAPGVVTGADGRARCAWAGGSDPEYLRYHDEEWGTPLHGDRSLFEKLSLEGFQSGLSWITILKRRPGFRAAFHDFDIEAIAAMTEHDVERLMLDVGIIRNRAKILATISNAAITLELVRDHPGALDELLWSFAPSRRTIRPTTYAQAPAVTAESTAMSTALRTLGYRFVGPTTLYALMQSSGMVDDHSANCWKPPPWELG